VRAAVREAPPAGDFLRYERAATLAWTGRASLLYDDGARLSSAVWHDPENLPERGYRYSPALAVLLSPFGALSPRPAFVAWSALCAGLTVLGIGLSASLAMRLLPGGRPAWLPAAAAFLPLLALYVENVKLGQMNCLAFGLSLGALWSFDRGRDRAAGLLAAGAAVAKHMPVVLLLWFAWKRRWNAALWGLGALAVLGYLVPTVVLGPAGHHGLLRQWVAQEDHLVTEEVAPPGASATPTTVHAAGQSLKAILYRYLTRTRYEHLENLTLTKEGIAKGEGILVNGGRQWEPAAVGRAWWAAMFLVLLAAAVATAPPAGGESRGGPLFALEAGMLLAALLLVSPESRNPHFQMLAPGYAGLAALLAAGRPRGRARWVVLGLAAAGAALVLLPTQGLVGRRAADVLLAHGSIGFGAVLVAAALAMALLLDEGEEEGGAGAPAGEARP